MINWKLTIALLLFIWNSIDAQEKQPMNCGTNTTQEDIADLLKNKALAKTLQRNNETTWVPIQFHLVANSSGSGRISPGRVLDALCKLNQDFEPTGLQFYILGEFQNLNNSAMYEMEFPPIPPGVSAQFALNRVDGAINIFIGNGLSSGNSGFYTGGSDVIYMDKRYVNDNDVILAHELGHFFGLPHTFFGWEDTTYDPNSPTPTQVFRGNTAYDVEYVDRDVNCETSGDYFCGTPADYILNWSSGCDYTGGAVDPDSVLLDPDETNFMSYYSFAGCEQYTFAEDQAMVMLANYMSRNEFDGTNIVEVPAVQESSVLLSPEDEEVIVGSEVTLSWEPSENAEMYQIQISRFVNFGIVAAQKFTTDSEIAFSDLSLDKQYYWRVYSFNRQNTCELIRSDQRTFTTSEFSSSVEENVADELRIITNPIRKGELLSILSPSELGPCSLTLYSLDGKVLSSLNTSIAKGRNEFESLSLVQSGAYILQFSSQHSQKAFKILVVD